jgi:hypothetical protein
MDLHASRATLAPLPAFKETHGADTAASIA